MLFVKCSSIWQKTFFFFLIWELTGPCLFRFGHTDIWYKSLPNPKPRKTIIMQVLFVLLREKLFLYCSCDCRVLSTMCCMVVLYSSFLLPVWYFGWYLKITEYSLRVAAFVEPVFICNLAQLRWRSSLLTKLSRCILLLPLFIKWCFKDSTGLGWHYLECFWCLMVNSI